MEVESDRDTQSRKRSELVHGYIRQMSKTLRVSPKVPVSIMNLCLQHYELKLPAFDHHECLNLTESFLTGNVFISHNKEYNDDDKDFCVSTEKGLTINKHEFEIRIVSEGIGWISIGFGDNFGYDSANSASYSFFIYLDCENPSEVTLKSNDEREEIILDSISGEDFFEIRTVKGTIDLDEKWIVFYVDDNPVIHKSFEYNGDKEIHAWIDFGGQFHHVLFQLYPSSFKCRFDRTLSMYSIYLVLIYLTNLDLDGSPKSDLCTLQFGLSEVWKKEHLC